jgi:hypothetical protein
MFSRLIKILIKKRGKILERHGVAAIGLDWRAAVATVAPAAPLPDLSPRWTQSALFGTTSFPE